MGKLKKIITSKYAILALALTMFSMLFQNCASDYNPAAYDNGSNGEPTELAAPIATAATGPFSLGFTANWTSTAPDLSPYHHHYLDISTSSDFSSFVPGYQNLDVGSYKLKSVTGLSSNTTYYYRVRLSDGTNVSTYSNSMSVTTANTAATLTAPVATAATGPFSLGFTANWTTTAIAGDSSYHHFLDVSTANDFSSYVPGYQDLDVGNVTSKAVTGLSAATTYYFRLRLGKDSATSIESNAISQITDAAATTLPAPVATAATPPYTLGFTANWTSAAPASNPAYHHYLDVSTASDFSSFIPGYENLDVGNTKSRAITGLAAGTTYYYRLRLFDGSKMSVNSNSISQTTDSQTVPAPIATAAIGPFSLSFNATWYSIAIPGDFTSTHYLDVSTTSDFSTFVPGYQNLNVGNVKKKLVTGLAPYTTYYYRVRFQQGAITSINSNVISMTTTTLQTEISVPAGNLSLAMNQKIETTLFSLTFQGDGNLILFSKVPGYMGIVWDIKYSNAAGCLQFGCMLHFQEDGNLAAYVLFSSYWDAKVTGVGNKLILQNSVPFLSIQNSAGFTVWRYDQ